ncbi:hypothetical protein [Mesorhizobium carmichaelinearum]|uniref:hypothetical protein n=1 Tax=Mesorhizobium carmichaelinearum TaxID=1208188 RepID=UPI001FCEA560|nr:hypothetical protein [Mesorhizobium carmichaelinearum]
MRALEAELGSREDRSELGFLRDLVVRDIASLQDLLADVSADKIVNAVDLLQKSETIYLICQLRSAPVVDLLRYVLTMLGKRCVLLDPSGGLYVLALACSADVPCSSSDGGIGEQTSAGSR